MITLSQKRNCNMCLALRYDHGTCNCLLKYQVEYEGWGKGKDPKPLEPCPKPKTNLDWIESAKWYRKATN